MYKTNKSVLHPFAFLVFSSWVYVAVMGFIYAIGNEIIMPSWIIYYAVIPQIFFLVFGIYITVTTKEQRRNNAPFERYPYITFFALFYNLHLLAAVMILRITAASSVIDFNNLPSMLAQAFLVVTALGLIQILIYEIYKKIFKKRRRSTYQAIWIFLGVVAFTVLVSVIFPVCYFFIMEKSKRAFMEFDDLILMLGINLLLCSWIVIYFISQFQLKNEVKLFIGLYDNAVKKAMSNDEMLDKQRKEQELIQEVLSKGGINIKYSDMYFILESQGIDMDKLPRILAASKPQDNEIDKERARFYSRNNVGNDVSIYPDKVEVNNDTKKIFDAISSYKLGIIYDGLYLDGIYSCGYLATNKGYGKIYKLVDSYQLLYCNIDCLKKDVIDEFRLDEIQFSQECINMIIPAETGDDGVRNVIDANALEEKYNLSKKDVSQILAIDFGGEDGIVIKVIKNNQNSAKYMQVFIDKDRGIVFKRTSDEDGLIIIKQSVNKDSDVFGLCMGLDEFYIDNTL